MKLKECIHCKKTKKVHEFVVNKSSHSGIRSICKKCHTEKYNKRVTPSGKMSIDDARMIEDFLKSNR